MIHFLSRFNSHNYIYYPMCMWNREWIMLSFLFKLFLFKFKKNIGMYKSKFLQVYDPLSL